MQAPPRKTPRRWLWWATGTLAAATLAVAIAEALDAHLVRGKDGRASWQLGAPDDPAAQADNKADTMAGVPRIGLLRVGAGRFAVDDLPSQTRLVVELRGGEGEALPTGARESTQEGTHPGYRGTVVGRWKALPMNLQLRTGSALPLLQDADNGSPPGTLRVEGTAGAAKIFFDGTASALLGERPLQGQLRLSGPSLAQVGAPLAVTLPQKPPLELRGAIAHDVGLWR